MPHETRAPFDAQWPALVTWRMLPWLPSLRSETTRALWRKVIAPRPKFQVLDWSLQADHLHFIAEAADDVAMERAMIGLGTSFSRRLNRLIGRIGGGRVFDHRYHRSALTTPQAVERAIRYVHDNWKKHGLAPPETKEHDPYSSAAEHARVMRRARTWIGRRLAALHL